MTDTESTGPLRSGGFGGWAIYVRPLALRPRLAAGVLLSANSTVMYRTVVRAALASLDIRCWQRRGQGSQFAYAEEEQDKPDHEDHGAGAAALDGDQAL